MLNLEKIGGKIADLRRQKNLKQNELADALFVTHQAVSKWENGKSIPSLDILYDLTKLFGVSIDYLLDDADIRDDDYETLFRQLPRESVISKFLTGDRLNDEIGKIFYLLSTSERKNIINLMIARRVQIYPENIWHLLSQQERTYLLGVILSDKYNYDLSMIYDQLTIEERKLVETRNREGPARVYYSYKRKE